MSSFSALRIDFTLKLSFFVFFFFSFRKCDKMTLLVHSLVLSSLIYKVFKFPKKINTQSTMVFKGVSF